MRGNPSSRSGSRRPRGRGGRGREETVTASAEGGPNGPSTNGAAPVAPPLNARDHLARDGALPAPDSPEILALRRLPLVGATRALLFWQIGVRSLADIANLDEAEFVNDPRVEAYPDGSIGDAFPLIQGYAQAITQGAPLVVAPEPVFETLEGPFIHFDLEFIAGIGEVFLWGLKRDAEPEITQWFGHSKEDQRESLIRFKTLVEEEDPLFVAYGSTASDEVAIRDAARRFNLEGQWLKDMRFFDLLQRVIFTESPETQRLYLPVRNLKCGVVAEWFGYRKPRSVDIKDGYHAFKLYQRYKQRPDPRVKDRLMRYNAEDLYQTEIIFNGLKDLFANAEP